MMSGLIAYGSLMAKHEIQSLAGDLASARPVQIKGFRRIFAQEPSWRKGTGIYRAVLTVVRSPTRVMNAILLTHLSEAIFSDLDIRERGYERQQISPTQISPWEDCQIDLSNLSHEIYIYVGTPNQYNQSLFPNLDYQDRCIKAAKEWGETFHHEFCQSTDNLYLS